MDRFIKATVLLLCLAKSLNGAPTQTVSSRTPCRDRHRQVSLELSEFRRIVSEPNYIPECDDTGRFWMPSQCSNVDVGFCFCVVPETGEIKEGTNSHFHARETLDCVPTAPPNDTRLCQQRQNEYLEFISQNEGVVGNIFYYYPECREEGSFTALQRDSVGFFCVDTQLGTKIPRSEEISRSRPLHEFVCQAYSEQWKNYLAWLKKTKIVSADHDEHEEVNATSCMPGFEFLECGCASVCQPGENMEELEISCEECAPVCTCPEGRYEFNGECLTGEECSEAEYQPDQHKVLDIYGAIWDEYNADHPHVIIEAYRKGTGVFNENGDWSESSPSGQENQEPTETIGEEEEEIIEETEEPPTYTSSEEEYEEEEEEEEEWEEMEEGEETTTPVTGNPDMEEVIYENEPEDPSETPSISTTTMDDYYSMEEEEEDYNGDGTEGVPSTPEGSLIFQILQGFAMQGQMTSRLRQEVSGMTSTLSNVQQQIQSVLEESELEDEEEETEWYEETPSTKPATKPTTESLQHLEAEFEDMSSPLKKVKTGAQQPTS